MAIPDIVKAISEAGKEFADRRRLIRFGISEETRKSRVKLLIVSTISTAVAITGQTPTKISALGIEIDPGHAVLFLIGLALFHAMVFVGFLQTTRNDKETINEIYQGLLYQNNEREAFTAQIANQLSPPRDREEWTEKVQEAFEIEKNWSNDALTSFKRRFVIEVTIPLWLGAITLAILIMVPVLKPYF